MINDLLKKLGFGDKEIEVYLAILKHGKIAPTDLSKVTGINRTTIYSVAKELTKKGVIAEDLGGNVLYFVSSQPKDLKNLAQKEERELAAKKILIDQAVTELQSLSRNKKYSIPKISFIYEEDLKDFLYKQAPEWSKSIMSADGIWWGFQDPSFVRHYQDWIDWYWQESAPKDLVLQLLTNRSEFEQQMAQRAYDRRVIKYWEQGGDFTATTWVNGDYLVMIMTERKPCYLVQIHDATLAHNMREMFKSIWNS